MHSLFPCLVCLFWVFAMAVALAGTAFWIWMIVECATKETDDRNNRLIWILVILLTHLIGALIYFFARRPERIRELGK